MQAPCSVQGLLQDYYKDEQLGPDNRWECADGCKGGCGKFVQATKQLSMVSASEEVVVSLKRYHGCANMGS